MVALLALMLSAAAPIPQAVDAGPLQLELVIAEVPQLFHVVDQLSGWNAFSHKGYRRYFSSAEHGGLSAEDEKVLAEHAQLRKQRGFGAVDAAFTSAAPLAEVLAAAVRQGQLTPDEAAVERRVLDHFRARLLPYLAERRPALEAVARTIAGSQATLAEYGALASRFFGGGTVAVRVVLTPAPEGSGGGTYSHGQLVVEVGDKAQPLDVLEHELWHAFADGHEGELKAAAQELGTDFETISEGLAYAVSPGIFRSPGAADALSRTVAADAAAQKSFFDLPYVRFNRLGLALRPTLEPALRGTGTLSTYLPIEKAVYRALAEVAHAEEHPLPCCFWFGMHDDGLAKAISRDVFDIWSRPLEPRFLDELRPRMRPHDVVFLALAGAASLPEPFAALLGDRAPACAALRAAHPSGEVAYDGAGGLRVLVFWAPDPLAVAARVRASPLLPQPRSEDR